MSRLLVAAAGATLCLPFTAPAASGQSPLPANHQTEPTLGLVPADGFLVVTVNVARLWDNPAARPLRDWVAAQKPEFLEPLLGVAPADLDRVTLYLPAVTAQGPPAAVLALSTRRPYDPARVRERLGAGTPVDGIYPVREPMPWLMFPDDRTLVFFKPGEATHKPAAFAKLLTRRTDGPLTPALTAAPKHDLVIGVNVPALAAMIGDDGPRLPREWSTFLPLLEARGAILTADFGQAASMKLTWTFADAATARRAAPVLDRARKELGEALARQGNSDDLLSTVGVIDWLQQVLRQARVAAQGDAVIATADVPYADPLARAVARLPKSVAQERKRVAAMNQLRQLGLAMHNYLSTHGFFPGDVTPSDKPVAMSWRVQILPYLLEQDDLFRQLDLTKPWNDPANLRVLERAEMPKVFEHPSRPAPKNHTYFRVFTRPKNAPGKAIPLLEEGQPGPKLTDISDGTSNTFLIVEAEEAVPWYQPDLLPYDGKLPVPGLGAKDGDTFLAVFCDGSVRTMQKKKLNEAILRALITRSGGEVIPPIE